MISPPEIRIESIPKDPGAHGIGAVKHQGGIEKRPPEKDDGKYGEDPYDNKIMESGIEYSLLGACFGLWDILLFLF